MTYYVTKASKQLKSRLFLNRFGCPDCVRSSGVKCQNVAFEYIYFFPVIILAPEVAKGMI